MASKAEIEMAKAVMVLVNSCTSLTGFDAYLGVNLNEIMVLAESEPEEVSDA